MHIVYHVNKPGDPAEVAKLYADSGLIRPVDDLPRMTRMLNNANLIVSAFDGGKLVGLARSLTDFAYVCYLADLAVAADYQRRGIGQALIRKTREYLGEEVMILLLAAATARDYYGHIGFARSNDCWFLPRQR